jgi:hypothetical protein
LTDGSIATVNVRDNGGYIAMLGRYNIDFEVAEELTTKIRVIGTVIAGNSPVLTMAPEIVMVNVGDVVDILLGVTTMDVEDGDIIIPINTETVNTTETGIQFVHYTATDSDGNSTISKRTYIVSSEADKAVVGTTHVIFAGDFNKRIGQVMSGASDIITAANARAFSLVDGSIAAVRISSDGGYTATEGIYTINFEVTQELSTKINAVATVRVGSMPTLVVAPEVLMVNVGAMIAPLTDVSGNDLEDGTLIPTTEDTVITTETGVKLVNYTVTDSDGNITKGSRTYVIVSETDKAVVGATHVLFASDFTQRVGQVVSDDTNIIKAANARAFSLADGNIATVNISSLGGYIGAVGEYSINFIVFDKCKSW